MKVQVHVTDLTLLEKDPDYKGHIEEREIPDSKLRHNMLCTWCEFPSYPECREWCHNEKLDREKESQLN